MNVQCHYVKPFSKAVQNMAIYSAANELELHATRAMHAQHCVTVVLHADCLLLSSGQLVGQAGPEGLDHEGLHTGPG